MEKIPLPRILSALSEEKCPFCQSTLAFLGNDDEEETEAALFSSCLDCGEFYVAINGKDEIILDPSTSYDGASNS